MRGWCFGALAGAVFLGLAGGAQAADTVTVGKSVGSLWAFLPVDVGMEEGIFAKYGINAEISALGSGPKLQQALASQSIDFGLSAGSDMAFAVKGSPVLAVAAFAEEPRSVVVMVNQDSPIKEVADLKGKLIGIPGLGTVSEWLLWHMAIAEGWGKDGIRIVAQGAVESNVAALRTHQIDAMTGPVEVGFNLEDKHEGRIAVSLAKYAPHFHAHIIFGQRSLIKEKPEVVDRFLKGFFASIAFIKANKEKTNEIAMKILNESHSIVDRTYDYEISMLLTDGMFDPKAIEVIKNSWVDLGMLPTLPNDDQFMTTQFLPVKP
jgi:NitT/TauT family transport system substrate-binding protein